MSNSVDNTIVFEAARTANQSVGFAQEEASRAQTALAKVKAEAADGAARAHGASRRDKANITSLTLQLRKSKDELSKMQAKMLEKDRQVIELDRLLKEWMHTAATFRAMAKRYGVKLGVTNEVWVEDFNQEVVNQSELNPDFHATEVGKKSKLMLGL